MTTTPLLGAPLRGIQDVSSLASLSQKDSQLLVHEFISFSTIKSLFHKLTQSTARLITV